MNKEEIATTYEEYKNGFELVEGLGRLACYQGLDYLEKLLEEDMCYSQQYEDTIVYVESHINRIEKENKQLKERINKCQNIVKKIKKILERDSFIENDCNFYINAFSEEFDKTEKIWQILNKLEEEILKGENNE